MTRWPRWARGDAAGQLAQYVQRGVVTALMPEDLARELPGPSGPPLERARRIYNVFARCGIAYVQEDPASEPSRQVIRTPDQVLSRPGHATCLDVAVTFAGTCLDAGLHPVVVVLDAAARGAPGHAVVVVWLEGSWPGGPDPDYPLSDAVHKVPPPEIIENIRASMGEPGAFAAIDVTAATRNHPRADGRTEPEPAAFEAAIAAGARMLTGDQWRWGTGIDIGTGYRAVDVLAMPHWPRRDVLTPPYLPVPGDGGPLEQVRARSHVIPYYRRDELDVLLDWFQAPGGQPQTRIAIVHGPGGAGKTHLAAELAAQLGREHWHAGFLVRKPDPADLSWLGSIASPLLAVIDYAEAAKTGDVISLLREIRGRPAPTCVLLTARSVGGWWDNDIAADLQSDAHLYTLFPVRLAGQHPRFSGVFRAALRAFGGPAASDTDADITPPMGGWTTLDLVMLAWLTANSTDRLPATRENLYEKILTHELARYWSRTYQKRHNSQVPIKVLRDVGACITLLGPSERRLTATLAGVEALATDGQWREQIAELVTDLLPPDPGDDTIAIRPDPVGDHLMTRELEADPGFFGRCLDIITGPEEQLNACISISRASQDSPASAARLASLALTHRPDLWRPALKVAEALGGPFVAALEELAAQDQTPLPLAELAETLPTGHTTLQGIALIAAERSLPQARTGSRWWQRTGRAVLAATLNNLAVRQADAGQRDQALATATKAVALRRQLARANPAAGRPDLALSLANLANQQADAGQRDQALATATEAAGHYRQLAQNNPAAFQPVLAAALNNLANRQADAGQREQALTTATEAVTLRRQLARANLAALRPDLAMSLSNLAVRQADAGQRDQALATATEAVGHYRQLAQDNPAAFRPGLAMALNNLAVRQAEAGQREEALATATEAAGHYRQLAQDDPAAFRSGLAIGLNTLSNQQADVGQRDQALATATEAVALRRQLAQAHPAAFRSDLAGSLSTLAVRQYEAGQREEALASSTEAAGHYRQLAQDNLAAFRSDLARALSNLAIGQADAGQRDQALATATESVGHYRQLAQDNPAAFRSGLAIGLNTLANQQADVGQREEALASATEVTGHYRQLAQDNPAAFQPGLAAALNNLAIGQADAGQRDQALATATEAVTLRRQLAQAHPAAFLSALAGSLNNLAVQQAEAGQREEALATATEAAGHYRQLAQDNPAAFLSDLVMALNTLSNQQADMGQREEALATAAEAVTLRRQLAQENPAAFLPDLAMSLHTLAARQAEVGQDDQALATATEAADHYRQLAQDNPAAFQPGLAAALNNLAVVQADTGQRDQALATATEAVTLRRQLAQAHPAAFLPDLAGSLNNLANRQAEAGQRDQALATATEAAGHYRQLAQDNPAAFLSDLVMALGNLASRQAEAGQRENAIGAFEAAFSDLGPGPQAELLVARARWRTGWDDQDGAHADLLRAARLADEEDSLAWSGRSRRAVRAVIQDQASGSGEDNLLSVLPAWTTEPLPDQLAAMLNRWIAAREWPQQEALLREAHAELLDTAGQHALTLTRKLFPEYETLEQLADVLQAVATNGLEPVLANLRADHSHAELLGRWLAAQTWLGSCQFLQQHPDLTTDPRTVALLEPGRDDPRIAQHLGIIRLTARLPIAETYDAVMDVMVAADTAIGFAETGDTDALADLWLAAPGLAGLPFIAPFLQAVWLVLDGNTPDGDPADTELPHSPATLITTAATQGRDIQRASGAARLRRLARRQPQHAQTLRDLAGLLASPDDIGRHRDQTANDAG